VSRGTIRRRGRNSFELRFELERVDGKRQRRCVSVKGGTLREAQRKLAELLVAADRGTLAEPSQDTVGRYLTHWLDSELTLAPKTKERYGEFLTQQIAPHLGDVKLQKLTPERLEQWHAALITAGLARALSATRIASSAGGYGVLSKTARSAATWPVFASRRKSRRPKSRY
jgi:hypothetical protein